MTNRLDPMTIRMVNNMCDMLWKYEGYNPQMRADIDDLRQRMTDCEVQSDDEDDWQGKTDRPREEGG